MNLTRITVHLIATASARLVSCRRELVQHELTFEECEAAGLPEGSTEPAVYELRVVGLAWWRLDAWLDGPEQREGCLNVKVLGHHIEVFYERRMQTLRAVPAGL